MSGRVSSLIAVMGLTALVSISARSSDTGARRVQVVYESDTRGYYLPCG